MSFFLSGLTWEEAKARCPEGVVPACHNSVDTVTISGPLESVKTFVAQLQEEGVFARNVNSAGVAFHSYFMDTIAVSLKAALSKVGVQTRQLIWPSYRHVCLTVECGTNLYGLPSRVDPRQTIDLWESREQRSKKENSQFLKK